MQSIFIDDMRKRPPHRMDVLANAVFGDYSPTLFRPGKYYKKGEIAYTYDGKGDITTWKCLKSGEYENAIQPGWEVWSIDDVRTRLAEIESILKNNYDIYETYSYPLSYYIHDVGVRDWERRGSYVELFNDSKYIPKKNYRIIDEQIAPLDDTALPDERKALLFLNKSNNVVTNLVRRIEMEGTHINRNRVRIPFPIDESLMGSYIFDLFVDGVYISSRYINIVTHDDGTKCVDIDFNYNGLEDRYVEQIEDGRLVFVPPINLGNDSEFIFVFYVSISHDLEISKQDLEVFIGDARDTKWISLSNIKITDRYQESIVYNNGIRMRDTQYIVAKDRISADKPEDRFVLGSYATVSVRTFEPVVDEAVTNVKQETVPMYGFETGVLAIPFLNYDEDSDHFLLFNDGGVLFGSQRWFEDHGYVNLYDDNIEMQPNEMAEFRMISRDKNMYLTTYILTAKEDNQVTFELPDRLKDHYFHMMFTENGQFISRTKYALSGRLLQIRNKYSKLIKAGERLELICFDYASEYGFTSLTNFQATWNPEYTEIELDNLPHGDNDEIDPEEPDTPDEPDYDINDLKYDPITNPTYTRLQYRPKSEPGTSWIKVQDKSISELRSKRYSDMSFVTGVDCDNQIIVSTSEGDIVRFDRTGVEDQRYNLKQCSRGGGTVITNTETDDFGNTYYLSRDVIGKVHLISPVVEANGGAVDNTMWEKTPYDADWRMQEPYMNERSMKSLTYIDGWLYLEYSIASLSNYTIGKINPANGSFFKMNLKTDLLPEGTQIHTAKVSRYTKNVYLGTVVTTGPNTSLFRLYEVNPNMSTAVPVPYGFDIDTDIDDTWAFKDIAVGKEYVFAVIMNEYNFTYYLVRYKLNDPYNVLMRVLPGEDENSVMIALDADDNCYMYDNYVTALTKINPENLEDVWVYSRTDFVDGVNECQNLFVDPVDYHVYMYYYSPNKEEKYRYLELEQNELPLPKYRHSTVFNGNESVTIYQPAAPARDLSWRLPSTNRYYIGGKTGNIFTFTQSGRELTKREQDGSLRINGNQFIPDNDETPVYIIPDDDYNYYVIKENIITKLNRYDRILWQYDGLGIISSITERFTYNRMSKELVFFYYDTTGMQALGKITSKGEFSVLPFTLPNGVPIEKTNCAVATDYMGNYYFAYSSKTVYRYSKTFTYLSHYGMDTDKIYETDGPAGDIVVVGKANVQAVYISAKNDNNGNTYSKVIKYNAIGSIIWEHDFLNTSDHARMAIDYADNVYMCDDREIRKIDEYGNYIWRFRYDSEAVRIEPDHILIDEFYRVFFMDGDGSVHRIDQYDLTLNPVPDEPKEPTEPKVETPDESETPENYIKVQRTFDIPFDYDESDSSMLIFTNTGQYIGNRFWELRRGKIYLKGTPIYENGWLDIVRIRNERESVKIGGV